MPNSKTDVFTLYNMSGDTLGGCWVWLGAWGGRSRTLRPYFQYGGKRQIAYRAVYELVHGVELTSDQLIRHSCDHGGKPYGCGNPEHLALGNNSMNMNDMKEKERHGLPHHAIRNIRKLLDQGRRQADIAELYGIAESTVSAINIGRNYGHVTERTDQQAQAVVDATRQDGEAPEE